MDVFKASMEKYVEKKRLQGEREKKQIARIERVAKAVKDVMESVQDMDGVVIRRRGYGMFRQQFLLEVHSFHIEDDQKHFYELCVKTGSLKNPEEPIYISVIHQGEFVHKTFRSEDPNKITEKVEAAVAYIADELFRLLYK